MFNKDLMEEHDGHSARVGVTCLKGATFWDTVMYLAAGRISQGVGFSGSYCIACWGVGEGWWGGGWWRSLHVHTCETLRNCCVALAHTFDATPDGVCGIGIMTFRACDMWDATQLMGWVGGDDDDDVPCPADMSRIGFAQTESCLGFAFAERMLPKTCAESLRHHNDQARTRQKPDWHHRKNLQKCQNHAKYIQIPFFFIHHDFDWRNA